MRTTAETVQRAPKDSNLRPSDSKSADVEVSERPTAENMLVRPPGDSCRGPLIQGVCPNSVPENAVGSPWWDARLAEHVLRVALKGLADRAAIVVGGGRS